MAHVPPQRLWPFVLAITGCNLFAGLGEERIVVDRRGAGEWTAAPECDPASDVVWLRTLGDFGWDEPGQIVPDGTGGYFLQGRFDGSVDLGSGPITTAGGLDFYLAHLDADGQARWTKRYGTAGPDEIGPWISAHPDGFVICGTNKTQLDFGGGPHTANGIDAYVALMSRQGELIWERWLEGPAEERCWGGTAVDPTTGDVYAGVLFKGEVTVDGQSYVGEAAGDAMVLRLDGADGSVEAARHWGDVGQDHINRLAALSDGTVVVTGYTEGSVDFGSGTLPGGPGSDAFLVRFRPDLTPVWGHVFASTGPAQGVGLAVSKDGDLVWTAKVDGMVDLGTGPVMGLADSGAVARVSADTGLATDVAFLSGYNGPVWLAETSDGSLLLAGSYLYDISVGGTSKVSGGGGNSQADPVLVKLSPDLQTVDWVQFAAESKKWESFGGVALAEEDTVIVVGHFYEQLDIEGCSLRTSVGESDTMLMKRKL